mmetsp:Transcript_15859/g.28950  ORF Transcript_15859/g.28950 Transcript_15859/m.28950 type:complete len:214 (+) Transcript_15859:97-738(+)
MTSGSGGDLPKHVLWGAPEVDDSSSGSSSNARAMLTEKLKDAVVVSSDSGDGESKGAEGETAKSSQSRDVRFDQTESEKQQPQGEGDDDDDDEDDGGDAVLSEPAWSLGSALHDQGGCRPCAHYATRQTCNLGAECDFCHLCTFQDLQRRRKERVKEQKKKKKRLRAEQWRQVSLDDTDHALSDADIARHGATSSSSAVQAISSDAVTTASST